MGRFLIVLLMALVAVPVASASVSLPPQIRIVYGQCPYESEPAGCYVGGVVYIERGDRFGLLHELGHAYDEQVMTDAARRRFESIMGYTGEWWAERSSPPAELFADAYAACRMNRRPDRGPWTDAYGYDPTLRQHRRVCNLISVTRGAG